MNENRKEELYVLLVILVCILATAILLFKEKSQPIENRVTLEVNGKVVLTMTNNCVFIEQTK